MSRAAQRGFVHARGLDLAFLLVLILIGIGVWQWFATLIGADFMLAWFLVWLMATAAAWWWTRKQTLVLRLPAGFLLFLGLAAVVGPLSWWSGSKLAAVAEAVTAAAAVKYLGMLWSARLEPRLAAGAPWYLDQSIDLIADIFRWLGISIIAWFAVGVLPLLLVLILPPEWIPWMALVWAFGITAYGLQRLRPGSPRFFKLSIGLYAFVLTAALMLAFKRQLLGPMEPDSFVLVAYTAYWPVVAAGFVEIVLLGTRKNSPTAQI